jgi:SAM-dependent methyltransferase
MDEDEGRGDGGAGSERETRSVTARSAARMMEQLSAPAPAPEPPRFEEAAARLLHARHLAAYGRALPLVEGRDVIEIGVHRGYGSRLLAPRARSFLAVDLSFEHASATHRAAGVRAVQADGQRLPVPDRAADVVVTFQVIEHVWDDRKYLREIARVLRPGGTLILSTPQARNRLLLRQAPWNDEHLREYDERTWAARLGEVFEEVRPFGLFGDRIPSAIEARRVWMDPWPHFFAGPWGRPLRLAGRAARYLRPSAAPVAETAIETALAEDDDALVRRYSFSEERLEEALDLFAICRRPADARPEPAFDGAAYWRERLSGRPGLDGAGTSYAPASWQRWLYRGKVRAYRRLLRRNGVDPRGRDVLDFGCGTGFFEDLWERLGARRAGGIDVVPEAIERLRRARPDRPYRCADLSKESPDASLFGSPEIVTAIDVLYHIVDDDALLATLRSLLSLQGEGGWFLFTDALREQETSPHVRFRSLHQWSQILAAIGYRIADREPVFAVNNNFTVAAARHPALAGFVQHAIDLPVLRTMPCVANNWAVLARAGTDRMRAGVAPGPGARAGASGERADSRRARGAGAVREGVPRG